MIRYNEFMKTILLSITFLFLYSINASAKVDFNCYSLFGVPAQVFATGSFNCGPEQAGKVVTDGPTKVICSYQAMCEALAENETPTQLTEAQIQNIQTTAPAENPFKFSMLSCEGQAVMEKGNLKDISCPSPNDCRKDVAFTFKVGDNRQLGGQNSVITKPNYQKEGTK